MTLDDFAQRPWLALDDSDLGGARGAPSMLNPEEARFYVWLSRTMAGVDGAVVDLGCFAGGSTAYLAEGTRQGGGQAQIHAFDQFAASEKVKERQLYSKGVAPFDGTDILPLAQQVLAPWAPNVHFHKGRIEDSVWEDGPIALLVLDASKTSETMDQMAAIFFPHLIPGQSIIVQQDELHWKEPWIAVQMEAFADHFEPLCHVPGGTVAYRCIKAIDQAALANGAVDGMSDQDMIAALSLAAERLSFLNVADKLARQQEAIRLNPGKRKSWSFKNRAPRM
ncbi:class I SAM-dependent methyltransferase [Roseovarius sp. 2305UL8-3]|uniref:class I SAM-dependent methyltransferase n=1 Tax=Roseovarius conchicola TaxID=3121636 RepID=UPI00352792AF